MITKDSFRELLIALSFTEELENVYRKKFASFDSKLEVDFNRLQISYPEEIIVNDRQICSFSNPENFVVFECVHRLLEKGYQPKDIELEKRWTLGHSSKGGRADICVRESTGQTNLMIIECKTYGYEHNKALNILKKDGGQLFSYLQQERSTKWISLYASDFENGELKYKNNIISSVDDPNILELAKKDESLKLYMNADSFENLFLAWKETYGSKLWEGLIFGEDTTAYHIGVKPLRKKDLKDFNPEDKVINQFEEILRHNNVSDKENAFNRLVALFICKLVDEIEKEDEDIVDFQYKQGSDTYESLQDRLQRLHRDGMEKFMKEETFYIAADYPDKLFSDYTGKKRRNAIQDLKEKFKMLKFYSNNDFAFKDVHNEELFLQNGKILVEMVQLFEKYRVVYPCRHQFLGDLFEQLLNKGFKQNEGQFFTPGPITRFIWDSLPIESLRDQKEGMKYPKIIDYACGAGHFLTDGIEAFNSIYESENYDWVSNKIYGIEKDYRLARVAKISLFMNGAGEGNIIFGDGLDNDKGKGIIPNTFDILVTNPPYSVAAFKSHLKLKDNKFELLDTISNEGGEIEVLFVERIAQLLKPEGIAAVILPSSILSKNSNSNTNARGLILRNFKLRAIVQLGSKTFSATGTNTVVLFLEKYDEPPKKQDLVSDSVSAIFNGEILDDWIDKEILENYLEDIDVEEELYRSFLLEERDYQDYSENEHFEMYITEFETSPQYKNLTKRTTYKKADSSEKQSLLNRQFFNYVKPIEEDKLFYFALVYNQETVIAISPAKNAAQKKFLGYEWSDRKGQEGIKIFGQGGMLYNPKNRDDHQKISYWIRQSFENSDVDITIDKEDIIGLVRTKKLFDFSRKTFNKNINLRLYKTFKPISRFELCKLRKFGHSIAILKGSSITQADTVEGDYKVVAGGVDYAYKHNQFNRIAPVVSISASGANAGFVNLWEENIYASDCTTVKTDNDIETRFIYYYLTAYQKEMFKLAKGAAQPHVYPDDISDFLIPNTPIEIQENLVLHCKKIEQEYELIKTKIEANQIQIEDILSNLDSLDKVGGVLRLSNKSIFDLTIGERVLSSQLSSDYTIPVYSANTFEPFGMIDKLLISDFSKPSVIWGIDGDWMVNTLPEGYKFYPTDHCGVLRVDDTRVNPRYMAHVLEREGKKMRFSRSFRASLDRISVISFEVPDIKIQDKEVRKIFEIERKQQVLKNKFEGYSKKIQEAVESFIK